MRKRTVDKLIAQAARAGDDTMIRQDLAAEFIVEMRKLLRKYNASIHGQKAGSVLRVYMDDHQVITGYEKLSDEDFR